MTRKEYERQEVIERITWGKLQYKGVEALAFQSFDSGNPEHRYCAVGAYRVGGAVVIRCCQDSFYIRVPKTARELYLSTALDHVESEQEHAQVIWRRYDGLEPTLATLIEQAARGTELYDQITT